MTKMLSLQLSFITQTENLKKSPVDMINLLFYQNVGETIYSR